jgi:subtilase family serine protease
MRLPRPALAAAATFMLAAALSGGGSAAVTGVAASPASAAGIVTIRPGALHAVITATATPPTTSFCKRHYGIACYLPRQVQRAYNLPALYAHGITGRDQTIIIVDSFGSPTIQRDLTRFDKATGLPAPPSLKVIQPAGKVSPYQPTSNREGWAGETDLDVEYAHTVAPGARILLVETPTSENEGTTGFPQIVTAEKYVINHHLGGVISQSFSATEQTFPSRQALLNLRGAYIDAARKGVTVLAASGDSGAADVRFNQVTYFLHRVTSWPDSDPLVTGVGGTQLHLNAAGDDVRPATVWNDTYNAATNEFIFGNSGPNPLAGGGGKSVIFGRPPYQNSVKKIVGSSRGVPDISMSGACNGAVDMYQSFAGQPAGWYPTCGTSEATPLFAGIVSLADQMAGHPLGPINPSLYRLLAEHAPGIVDVTSGNNTVSFTQSGKRYTVTGFAARRGYDLASGVGTVNALLFVPELARAAGHPTSAAPASAGPASVGPAPAGSRFQPMAFFQPLTLVQP